MKYLKSAAVSILVSLAGYGAQAAVKCNNVPNMMGLYTSETQGTSAYAYYTFVFSCNSSGELTGNYVRYDSVGETTATKTAEMANMSYNSDGTLTAVATTTFDYYSPNMTGKKLIIEFYFSEDFQTWTGSWSTSDGNTGSWEGKKQGFRN